MAYRSPGYPGVRRRRRGRLLPLILVLLVVAAAAALLISRKVSNDNKRAAAKRSYSSAVATADTFLGDWQHSDAAGMAALTTADTAALVRERIPAETSSLQIVSARYVPGTVVVAGSAANTTGSVPFQATVSLRGLGTWSYHGQLALRRTAKVWAVVFSPESIYPGLHAGDTLARNHIQATRGQLLLSDGQPLDGRDAELAGNLIGTVGKLTAAQAVAAGPLFEAGDLAGVGGLERGENKVLAGTPGGSLTLRSAAGALLATLVERTPVAGTSVRLSIDLAVQGDAERALAAVPAGQTGSLVAIDVATGAVEALVNAPYDGYGRAIRGQYPPGSTFKIITSTAALMAGKSAATPLDCPATVTVDGEVFKNSESEAFGAIDLETAFAKSCNTAFINLEQELPAGAVGAAAKLYGFSAAPAPSVNAIGGGPLPLTSFGGSYPPPTDGAAAAAQAIGQGADLVSPLQMASVAAAVGAGRWRQPFVTATAPAGNPTHVLPAAVDAALHTFMAAVVTSGTAKDSGLPAGTFGKTGTGEVGTANPPATVAWFVGFRDGIAFACQVGDANKSGGFGASSAAPIVAAFLRDLGQ